VRNSIWLAEGLSRTSSPIDVNGTGPAPATQVRQIGADQADLNAANDFTDPERVAIRELGAVDLTGGEYVFPPHAVTLLSIPLG